MLGVPNARDDVFAKCARVEFVKERLIVDEESREGTVRGSKEGPNTLGQV